MTEKKEVLYVKEDAAYLGIYPVTVYIYIKKNKIPAFRIEKLAIQ